MIVVRNCFTAKPGIAGKLAAQLKEAAASSKLGKYRVVPRQNTTRFANCVAKIAPAPEMARVSVTMAGTSNPVRPQMIGKNLTATHPFARRASVYYKDGRPVGIGSGSRFVTVMQTAEPRFPAHTARSQRTHSVARSLFVQAKMSPVFVVIADIVGKKSLRVPRVDGNYMIEQVPATTPDPAFPNTVLPGTFVRRLNSIDLHRSHGNSNF
jgi:hypothetical protein